jgi:hypothetical protein
MDRQLLQHTADIYRNIEIVSRILPPEGFHKLGLAIWAGEISREHLVAGPAASTRD